jgi:serine/alanine adding enzyme
LGKKVFDMGGGKAGGNIETFKRNFCGQKGVVEYYAIKKIRNEEIYRKLLDQKDEIKNENFFPLYRG